MGGKGCQGSVSRIPADLKSCQRVDPDAVKTKGNFRVARPFLSHPCGVGALADSAYMRAATRSARAPMVRLGFTPKARGMMEPSAT